MILADYFAPSRISSILGACAFLFLTAGIAFGLQKLPMLFIAEICPQGLRLHFLPVHFSCPLGDHVDLLLDDDGRRGHSGAGVPTHPREDPLLVLVHHIRV